MRFKQNAEGIFSGLFRLERLFDRDIEQQIKHIEVGPSTADPLPEDRIYMRSVIVTPTRVVLNHPVIETSNRVIRAWPGFQDRFIRVGSVQTLPPTVLELTIREDLQMRARSFALTLDCKKRTQRSGLVIIP